MGFEPIGLQLQISRSFCFSLDAPDFSWRHRTPDLCEK
jgi:hypothetical protein